MNFWVGWVNPESCWRPLYLTHETSPNSFYLLSIYIDLLIVVNHVLECDFRHYFTIRHNCFYERPLTVAGFEPCSAQLSHVSESNALTNCAILAYILYDYSHVSWTGKLLITNLELSRSAIKMEACCSRGMGEEIQGTLFDLPATSVSCCSLFPGAALCTLFTAPNWSDLGTSIK